MEHQHDALPSPKLYWGLYRKGNLYSRAVGNWQPFGECRQDEWGVDNAPSVGEGQKEREEMSATFFSFSEGNLKGKNDGS